MRDFFVDPAQTNLELYAQAIRHGWEPPQRRMLADAYQFALRQVYPLARGSGKPFIAHLVGTASLVLESACPDDWVVAALLHALYQDRVPFEGGLPPVDRRNVVSDRFGSSVDDIVFRYTAFESTDLGRFLPGNADAERDVLTIRLADELEDLTGHALALHGDERSDALGLKGGYPSRRDAKDLESGSLLGISARLQLDGIRRGLAHWLDFSATPAELSDMRTGWLSSVELSLELLSRRSSSVE